LNVYRNAEPSELAELHPSDRLMVQLIKIDRLGPRIEGMLYKLSFDESWALLDKVARLVLYRRPFTEAYLSGGQDAF
jgi:cytokinesis protein